MAISSGIVKRASSVIMYGVPGIGKTTLAAKIPRCVFLDLEHGTDFLDVSRDTLGPDGLLATLRELYKQREQFGTLVIDSLTAAEKIASGELCKRNAWSSLISPGYGNGYKALKNELGNFRDSIDAFRDAGVNVVLIAHSKARAVSDPATGDTFDRLEFDCDKDVGPMLMSSADGVFLLKQKTTVISDGGKSKVVGTGKRVIMTADRPGFLAKSRWKELPDEIQEPDFENFWKHFIK